jgi:cob(I)alamin adenosyltransferase
MLGRMRIYTRTGDDGSTGLLGPGRVSKADPRVEAYGCVDELNASLGVARALDTAGWFAATLDHAQPRLFVLGARLATAGEEPRARLEALADADIAALETAIDGFENELPPLTRFVLPGGTPLGAELHRARTVCRRAERRVVALADAHAIDPRGVRFLNRLADLLFVMARVANHRGGATETTWSARAGG